jgi:hypothetical protein
MNNLGTRDGFLFSALQSRWFRQIQKRQMTTLRRYLALLAIALWMGGFTFYTLIVIPTGAKVLGSERQVGFITQQVTQWLNLIGIGTLLLLLWNTLAELSSTPKRLFRLGLIATWAAMAVTLIGLFISHGWIDALLDIENKKVHGLGHFYDLHRLYMVIATVQWCAALAHLWLMLRVGENTAPLARPA